MPANELHGKHVAKLPIDDAVFKLFYKWNSKEKLHSCTIIRKSMIVQNSILKKEKSYVVISHALS